MWEMSDKRADDSCFFFSLFCTRARIHSHCEPAPLSFHLHLVYTCVYVCVSQSGSFCPNRWRESSRQTRERKEWREWREREREKERPAGLILLNRSCSCSVRERFVYPNPTLSPWTAHLLPGMAMSLRNSHRMTETGSVKRVMSDRGGCVGGKKEEREEGKKARQSRREEDGETRSNVKEEEGSNKNRNRPFFSPQSCRHGHCVHTPSVIS